MNTKAKTFTRFIPYSTPNQKKFRPYFVAVKSDHDEDSLDAAKAHDVIMGLISGTETKGPIAEFAKELGIDSAVVGFFYGAILKR